MSKKTEILQQFADTYEEHVKVINERNKSDKEIAEQQLSVRDRVDISLKDYNDMKKQISELTSELYTVKNTLKKLVKPFIAANISPEICEKMLNGEVIDSEIKTFEDATMPYDIFKLAYIVTMKKEH